MEVDELDGDENYNTEKTVSKVPQAISSPEPVRHRYASNARDSRIQSMSSGTKLLNAKEAALLDGKALEADRDDPLR